MLLQSSNARLVLSIAFLFAAFLSQNVIAQVKIGVVDLQLAVTSTKEGKRAKEKLEKLTKQKQKELDKKTERIKKMEKDMESQMQVLSEDGKKKLIQTYRQELMELQKLYMENQTFLAKKKSELLQPILKKMGRVIKEIAERDGYTVILDSSVGAVIYVDPANDLTNEVIRRFNRHR